jgi:hypothetical protein
MRKLKKNALKILSHSTQGENIWENPGADSGIILKLILKKLYALHWSGILSFMTETAVDHS